MARFVYYLCPDCGGKFRWLHHPSDSPPPDRCTLCNAWVSADEPPQEVFVPQAPGIRESPFAKSVDQTYRAMESASIERAKEAADMAGVPEVEMSHLKLTNMREPSEMREGDTAAIMPNVGQAERNLTVGPSKPGWQMMEGGVPNMAPGVGPAKSGEATRANVTAGHSQRAQSMISAGTIGSYKP